ncbi:MAG TPA: LysR family transcriptional regulator [Kofleriaceae bacterium]|nr:LysR family transcriptional regulator [Kofleriaceae bacterium]
MANAPLLRLHTSAPPPGDQPGRGCRIVNLRLTMSRTEDLFTGVLPFVRTAEERSFRRAAQRLGVTTAAVSKAVQRLEQGLGVKLLARTSRTVAITPEGAAFLERCRIAIESLQAGRDQVVQSRRLARGLVHVTMPFILGPVIARELPALAARHPELVVRCTLTDRNVRLVDEGIDVAIRIGGREDSSLVSRLLRPTTWVVVASPVYLGRRGSPQHPDELSRHNCLRFVGPNGRARDWTFLDVQTGRSLVRPVDGNLMIDQGEHMLEAARSGLGICQVLNFMVDDLVRAGRLVELLASYAAPGPTIQALTAPDRSRSPNVRAVFAFLVEAFGRPPRSP